MDDTWGPYRLPENGLAFGWRNFRTLKRLQVEYKTKIQGMWFLEILKSSRLQVGGLHRFMRGV